MTFQMRLSSSICNHFKNNFQYFLSFLTSILYILPIPNLKCSDWFTFEFLKSDTAALNYVSLSSHVNYIFLLQLFVFQIYTSLVPEFTIRVCACVLTHASFCLYFTTMGIIIGQQACSTQKLGYICTLR